MHENRDNLKLILFVMTLGSSMYGMFTPIYYLNNGVPYDRVLIALAFWGVGGFFSGMLGNYLIHKMGVKVFIIGRGLLEPLIIIMLNLFPLIRYPPELQFFLSGFVALSFWVSMDALTALTTEKENRSSQQSSIYSGMWFASIVAPFIGGFIIKNFSYTVLFIFSLLLVLGGGILSFKLNLSMKASRKFHFFPKLSSPVSVHFILVFLRGVTFGAVAWLFPLMIYGMTQSEITLGSLGTAMSIIALITNSVAGFLIDKLHKKIIPVFFALSSFSWLFLFLAGRDTMILLIVVVNVFYYMINLGLNTLFFNALEHEDVISCVSERMMAFSLGGIIPLVLALFFSDAAAMLASCIAVILSIPLLRNA